MAKMSIESPTSYFSATKQSTCSCGTPHDGDNVARVSDWLRRIYVRVGDSQSKRVGAKVILVATHCGQTSKYSNRIELSAIPDELAALVVGQASVDSHEMIGISDLKRLIAHHAATLPHMGEVVPKHWIMKRDAILALRGEGLKTISYAEFEKHCGSQPYRVPSDQAFILAKQFLHRSGRAAFYGRRIPGEEGSFQDRLEGQRLILDAEWLTKAVVRVVDDLKTREAGGVLDHGRLYYLWREHGRTDWEVYEEGDFAFLIALLHTLNVSYVLKGQSDRSLVAELVPDAPPANWPWSSPGNIQERTFICEIKGQAYGLMARLNVETFGDHVRVPGSSGRGYFWQRGIFLRETASGNEALLELIEKGTDTLRVLVRGPHPDALFWRLHGTVRETVKFWPGLAERIAFKVPCLTNKGSANACMGDFKIDALFKLKNKHPEGSISCQDCGRAHKYNALLGGLSGHNLDVDAEQAFERFTNRVEKTIEAAAKDVISVVRSVDDRLALSLPALLAEVEGGRIEAQALYRAFISRTDALCPRLFSIEEVPGGLVTRIKSLVVGRTYRVRLFCEYSGETSVDRNIVVSQDWLRKLAPYFGYAAVALAGIAPQAGKLSLGMLSASYSMMAFSRQFRDDPGATVLGRLPTDGRAGYADGADLRVLHAFLKTYHIGPDYGGMERLEMGKIWHWVSKSVYETYRPATPIVQRHVQSAVDRVSQAQPEKRRLQS